MNLKKEKTITVKLYLANLYNKIMFSNYGNSKKCLEFAYIISDYLYFRWYQRLHKL